MTKIKQIKEKLNIYKDDLEVSAKVVFKNKGGFEEVKFIEFEGFFITNNDGTFVVNILLNENN